MIKRRLAEGGRHPGNAVSGKTLVPHGFPEVSGGHGWEGTGLC